MSNIGPVLDISAGGMRVICPEVPPKRIRITLQGFNLPGPLLAELAWSKKAGFRKHEVGFKFVDVTPEVARMLTAIAGTHRDRRAI